MKDYHSPMTNNWARPALPSSRIIKIQRKYLPLFHAIVNFRSITLLFLPVPTFFSYHLVVLVFVYGRYYDKQHWYLLANVYTRYSQLSCILPNRTTRFVIDSEMVYSGTEMECNRNCLVYPSARIWIAEIFSMIR